MDFFLPRASSCFLFLALSVAVVKVCSDQMFFVVSPCETDKKLQQGMLVYFHFGRATPRN